jgi:hypothetical protein
MLLAVDDRACILLLTGLLVVVLLTVVSGILEGCTVRVVFLKMTCFVTAVSRFAVADFWINNCCY